MTAWPAIESLALAAHGIERAETADCTVDESLGSGAFDSTDD